MKCLAFLIAIVVGCVTVGEGFFFDTLFGSTGIPPTTITTTPAPVKPVIDFNADLHCPQHLPRTKYLMYNTFSGHCFQLRVRKKTDWHSAQSDCEINGGHLAVIQAWSDDSFIAFRSHVALAYHSDKYLWIGLSDEAHEGIFTWVNNARLNYTSWDDKEPNGGTSDNCVTYNREKDKWEDASCALMYPWICQYEKSAKPQQSSSATPTPVITTTTTSVTTTFPTTTSPTTTARKSTTLKIANTTTEEKTGVIVIGG